MQSYFVAGTIKGQRGFAIANASAIIRYHFLQISSPRYEGVL